MTNPASMDPKIYEHNVTVLKELDAGDLLEFPRGAYSHWAVYIGQEMVIHLAGEDSDGIDANVKPEHMFTICGVSFNKAKVCKDKFWNVVWGCKARKNNSKDKTHSPKSPRQIVEDAMSRLGEVGYNVVFRNCEHFAKWCRYGIVKSDQVENVVTGAAVGLAAGATLGLVYAIAKFWNKEDDEKEKKQKT